MHPKNPKTQNDPSKNFTLFRFSQNIQEKRIAQKTRLKEKINNVILNYLVQEGFQASALKLSQEAGILLTNGEIKLKDDSKILSKHIVNNIPGYTGQSYSGEPFTKYGKVYEKGYVKGFSSIEKRKQIKYLILRGDILQAIRVISTYYPTILDSDNLLLFKLLRLNLIEMIRSHKTNSETPLDGNGISDIDPEKKFLNDVLTFVRENLLNKVTHSMDLLRQLEVTMSLLCFDFDPKGKADQISDLPEELRSLLDLSLRNKCYRAVNKVILDLEMSSPLELQYHGVTIDEVNLSLAHEKGLTLFSEDPNDLDSSDIEIKPGPDVLKSIESMISAVPEPLYQPQSPEKNIDSEHELKSDESTSHSKLEEIARLWLATELILLLEKFIPKKRYFQDSEDENNFI